MAFAKNAASSGVAFRICTFVICVSYFFTKIVSHIFADYLPQSSVL
jgi:hypothetical protein